MKKAQQTHKDSNVSRKILRKNKKAYFEYNVLNTYTCGLVLLGYEVKSIREGKYNFSDCFARVKQPQLYLYNFHISPYKFHTTETPDPLRVRILLAKKHEIEKMRKSTEQKGRTLIPLDIFLQRGFIKTTLGVCTGKKTHEKKDTIKQRMIDRETARDIKQYIQ